jgi:hypothetical protein
MRSMNPRLSLGAAALMIGSSVNYFGDRLLGVRLELFHDLATTFSPFALLDIFVVPCIAGLAVAAVMGRGAKWVSCFPPVIVHGISYADLWIGGDIPDGSLLAPFGWWGFFVVLAIESGMIGGVFGEIFIKRIYSRPDAARAVGRGPAPRSRAR